MGLSGLNIASTELRRVLPHFTHTLQKRSAGTVFPTVSLIFKAHKVRRGRTVLGRRKEKPVFFLFFFSYAPWLAPAVDALSLKKTLVKNMDFSYFSPAEFILEKICKVPSLLVNFSMFHTDRPCHLK